MPTSAQHKLELAVGYGTLAGGNHRAQRGRFGCVCVCVRGNDKRPSIGCRVFDDHPSSWRRFRGHVRGLEPIGGSAQELEHRSACPSKSVQEKRIVVEIRALSSHAPISDFRTATSNPSGRHPIGSQPPDAPNALAEIGDVVGNRTTDGRQGVVNRSPLIDAAATGCDRAPTCVHTAGSHKFAARAVLSAREAWRAGAARVAPARAAWPLPRTCEETRHASA